MIDTDFLREHYGSLDDHELQRLARGELVPEARALLEGEMRSRGIDFTGAFTRGSSERRTPEAKPRDSSAENPYRPPVAAVADAIGEVAALKVSGVLRLFQAMVIASAAIGLLLFFWPYLPIPVPERMATFRSLAGAGALASAVTDIVFTVAQPLYLLSAVGLYFLRWWGRLLFVATYAATMLAMLAGGIAVQFPWESLLATVATLIDGAVLVLSFVPPLSEYFSQERT